MKPAELRRRYARLEERMDRDQRAFVRSAVLYCIMGYLLLAGGLLTASVICGFVFAALALNEIGTEGFWVAVCFAVPVLFFSLAFLIMWRIIRRIKPPNGYPLSEKEAPDIFAMVEEARRKLGAPRIHGIYLEPMYNAALSTVPRFGLLGPARHYILIGMPFLLAHTREELLATIAHEVGHTAGDQSRLRQWIHTVAIAWHSVIEQKEGAPATVLHRIAEKYIDGLHMRSTILRRHFEYAADRASLEVAGRDAALSSLYRVDFYGLAMNRFVFPAIWRRAVTDDLPPQGLLEMQAEELARPLTGERESLIRKTLLERHTVCTDTHPCLRERLRALGIESEYDLPPVTPTAPEHSAVQLLEPATRAHYMQLFGNAWRAAVIQEWRARHAYEKERSKRLAELQAQETLSPDDEWVRAAILSERTDDAEAMRILQEFLSHNPNHPDASFSLGMLLLGFEQLEEAKRRLAPAMAANSGYRARALVELRQYYEEKGLSDELNETIRKMEELDKEAEKTNYERGTVFMHDVFLPAKMSAAETGELAKKLKPYRMIQRAWVVRKEVKYMADIPCHVLLLEVERSAFDIDRTNKELCLLRDVAGITNREYLIAYHHDTFETPRKKIMAVPGSLLFDRKTEAVTA